MQSLQTYLEDAGVVAGNATPLNTMGMGNPMPATDGKPGSEPMCGKCKKEKIVKRKKKIEESILDDEDDIVDNNDDVYSSLVKKYSNNYPVNLPGHDCFGQKLKVGDWVAYIPQGLGRAAVFIQFGIVRKITPKSIQINCSKYDEGGDWYGVGKGYDQCRPSCVFKIDKDCFMKNVK